MTATRPEANNQYSSRGARFRRVSTRLRPVLAGGLLGAALLVVAEFSTLYSVHLTSSISPTGSVSVGSHNAYALIPIALLAAVLAWRAARGSGRLELVALALLGSVTLAIALIGDYPDTHARGISHQITLASTTAGAGLYIETLGGVVLLLTGGIALLAGAPAEVRSAS